MTIPVFLNGFKIHKIVDDIILSPRTIGTTMNNVYADQGSNRHGQAFLYNTRGIKQISFDIYVRGSHQRFIDVTNEIASILDVKEEVETQEAILTLAKQNAVNIIKALTSPIVEQLDAEYQLVIE